MPIDVTAIVTTAPAQEEGMDVKILGVDGEETGATIRVAGPDSKRVKKARAHLIQERSDMRIRTTTAARMDYESRYMAAAACVSWTGFTAGTEEFVCTIPNAMKLFESAPDYQEQVEAKSSNRALFTKS